MPAWLQDNRDFDNVAAGLATVDFAPEEVDALMGENWLKFFDDNFGQIDAQPSAAS